MWEALQQLGLADYTCRSQKVLKNHLVGTKVDFQVSGPQPHRTYPDIAALIEGANLPDEVKELSGRIFRLLAEAESLVHQQPLELVHFHEVGAVDSILDIVGAAYCCHRLGISRVYASALPMGQGMIASAHGLLPNPAPATALLLQEVPVYGTEVRAELVTPTGAAILKGLSACFDPLPPFMPEKVGYGAGNRDLPNRPNLLRLVLGRSTLPVGRHERVLVLETNLDDMIPEWYEHLMNALFQAGALDVAYFPMQMKKNRPGIGLTVVAPLEYRESILEVLFAESTTLGVQAAGDGAGGGEPVAGNHRDPVWPAAGQGGRDRRPAPGAAGV